MIVGKVVYLTSAMSGRLNWTKDGQAPATELVLSAARAAATGAVVS
jgi:hypothetical protein